MQHLKQTELWRLAPLASGGCISIACICQLANSFGSFPIDRVLTVQMRSKKGARKRLSAFGCTLSIAGKSDFERAAPTCANVPSLPSPLVRIGIRFRSCFSSLILHHRLHLDTRATVLLGPSHRFRQLESVELSGPVCRGTRELASAPLRTAARSFKPQA